MNKRYLWLASALLVLAGCAKSVDPVVEPKPAAKANDPWTLQDLSSQMKKGPAGEHSLQADFAGTRSSVAMNEAGTSAYTVWSEGDSFDMYALEPGTQDLYYAPFYTFAGVAGTAAILPDGSVSVALVNFGDRDRTVDLTLPVTVQDYTLYRFRTRLESQVVSGSTFVLPAQSVAVLAK